MYPLLVVANAEEDGPCTYSEGSPNVNYFAHPEQCGSYFLCSQGTIEYLLTGFRPGLLRELD